MKNPQILEKKVHTALCQFIFPISLDEDIQQKLKKQLEQDGFSRFSLGNREMENSFYGRNYRVSHKDMERYYLPFTNNVLFPHDEDEKSFQRYSKAINKHYRFEMMHSNCSFTIHSVDMLLCPFDLGFITIRVEINPENLSLTGALEFVSRFRVLQNMNDLDESARVIDEGISYREIEEFIFGALVPKTLNFLDRSTMDDVYFEKLPFFIDERMYVQSYIALEEGADISSVDLYRIAKIDGVDLEGKPFIGSSNMDFIEDYIDKHVHKQWAPYAYYVTSEECFCCVTNYPNPLRTKLANKMYGEYYYGLLLNLFHKIVLLKLSNRYSHVQVERSHDEVEELIRLITTFSARYYFIEEVSQSQGREIFIRLRKLYGNSELFSDVKETLKDLFKYQDNLNSRRSRYLLNILTIYTVISGIYGMNQVIEDFKGPIDWSKMQQYSIFEYIALIVALTGILISFGLAFGVVWKWAKDVAKKRRY